MSEIKNGGLGLYGAEHSNYNHMITLGFKWLILETSVCLNTFTAAYVTHIGKTLDTLRYPAWSDTHLF